MKNALTEIGDYPKMSSHLKVEGTPNNERAHYLLKNTRTGKMLKLGDNEYSVLASLDGKTSIGEIREKFNQAAPGSLEALIESFYNLHLLEQDCAPEEVRKGAKGFFKSLNLEKVFKVKFNFGNPDKLLTALYRPFKFIFNKYFVIATTLLALYGIGILLFNISTTANLFWEQVSNGEVLILFIPLFFVFILHEFSHGLTTKHYGGEIREMGFMLFYLRPAFYVDITDSYKFKKRERIAVYFAGLYFQLVLNGLILLGLQLAGFPLHKTGRLLWGFAAFNMLMIVMNLLPFIKLDGYWILTVILGIDNLRTKSFNACKRFVFETLLGIEEKASVNGDVPTLKEKLTYYIFGVTAISFTFFFVIYLMFDMAKILVLVIENVGLAIFALLLLLVLAAIVKIIFSLFATAFKNGVMPVLRLLLLLLIVSAAVYFTLTGVSLEYDIDAVYRLETYAANESGKGTNSLALVYLDKDDLEHVKKGDKVIVSLYRNGIKSTYEGTVTSEKYKKEKVYSSAFAALTAGPEDLPTSFKYTLPVRFKGTDTLFNNTLMAGSSISLGKVKIHRYIVIAVKALLPA